jgi:predicted pyridoxine 5'-phosphate oxidase superfamily flavin-nucleotide-binding protein
MAHLPEQVVKVLEGGHTLWVATATTEGYPNITIKGSGAVADSEHLYFADLFSKKTRANLVQNPFVAIGIHDTESNVAVQVKGSVTLSDSGALYEKVVAALKAKAPGLPAPKYVVEVAVESVWDMTPGQNAGNQIA